MTALIGGIIIGAWVFIFIWISSKVLDQKTIVNWWLVLLCVWMGMGISSIFTVAVRISEIVK